MRTPEAAGTTRTLEDAATHTRDGLGADPIGLTVLWHADPSRVGHRVAFDGPRVEVSRLAPDFADEAGVGTGPLSDPFLRASPQTLALRPAPSRTANFGVSQPRNTSSIPAASFLELAARPGTGLDHGLWESS